MFVVVLCAGSGNSWNRISRPSEGGGLRLDGADQTDSLLTPSEFRGIDGVMINFMIYCFLCAVIFPSRWPHPGNKSIGHSGLIVGLLSTLLIEVTVMNWANY